MEVYGGGLAKQRRAKLLSIALRIGSINPSQVSAEDRKLIGQKTSGVGDTSKGVLGTIGGAIGDIGYGVGNLGSDLGTFAKNLPGGVYGTGKAIVQDVVGGPSMSALPGTNLPGQEKSNFERVVWEPSVQGLKSDAATLGQLITGRPQRFLDHPLSPLLTLGAIASGGATGAAKVGGSMSRRQAMLGTPESSIGRLGQNLSRITSTSGRPDTLSDFTRRYSSSPTFKLGQKATDKIVTSRLGNRMNLPILQDRYVMKRYLDQTFGTARQASEHRIGLVTKPLVRTMNRMTPEERVASYYALRGVNTPELIEAYRVRLQDSLSGSERAAIGETVDTPHIGRLAKDLVSPDAARAQLDNLSNPVVIRHLLAPTNSMREFGTMWDDYVQSRHGYLGIERSAHEEHIGALQRELDPDLEELVTPEGGINPSYVPDVPARDMSFQQRRRWGPLNFRPTFGRNARLSGVFTGKLRASEPLRNPIAPYLKGSSMETVLSGAQRTDPQLFVDHVRRIEDDLVMREFNVATVEQLAFKDPARGTQSFRDSDEMNDALVRRMADARASPIATPDEWKKWDPRNWVLVTPDLPVRWYREGSNSVENVLRTLDDQGIDVNSITKRDLERLLSDDARGFWETTLGAARVPGVAIPKDAFKRVVDNIEASRPYIPGVAQYARLLNTWRTLTLAYMPRWLVNTAVGSTVMAMIKGVALPRYYQQGMRLAKEDNLPASVRLGGVVSGEALEAGSRVGRGHAPTRVIFKTVQGVEDFFRQASFVQSLEKGAKQKMAESGQILDKYRPFWNESRSEYIDNLIREHPDLVRQAIEDVDHFAYNFTSLSPFERRYLRLFIPFWGWYKFITKFAYRLPAEYPGRTRIMAAISDIGQNIEDEQGPIPPWVRGSIILGRKDGMLNYLPTMGLNPLSQFANPFSGEGTITGLMRLGQLSPAIQASLSGMGINTMDAGEQAISPLEGVAQGWSGLTDTQTGESVSVGERGAGRRILRSLLTSVPQVRLADLAYNEGRPSYPEAIPLLERRNMPVQDASVRNVSPLGLLNQFFGAQPRNYNVRRYANQLPRRAKYARKAARRQLKAGKN